MDTHTQPQPASHEKFLRSHSNLKLRINYHSINKCYMIHKQHLIHILLYATTNLIASTTTILNSSEISDIKEEICFIKRSTLPSFPV